mmetsp:Transcript_76760/g.217109  ORF Transcript_76760/g.217109 Transcript_76760/m.217109 type:complete len:238 (-) Transcript_76760:239-952(-)|eukprot:CAMPEP_0179298914 /NCGR_PEP_ID=MMETSP0797-20121207/46240_1 /TAXON_ID=47934 /ORGANISM="Dinophysis acuminata, Strain DAEP01" /LENGTH=237 /DNA_ID=CAMNT_0021008319 /DNA_START=92 /DNA_END=805 /DNA_ORIENTATION=-
MRWLILPCFALCAAALSVQQPGSTQGPGIQVIGAGRQRTGTRSLAQALSMLGYNTAHGLETDNGKSIDKTGVYLFSDEVFNYIQPHAAEVAVQSVHSTQWTSQKTWLDSKNYTALTDSPYNNHYKVLASEYPSAKVILTVHPGGPDHWAVSAIKNGLKQVHQFSPTPGCYVHEDSAATRAQCAEAYQTWNQEVMASMPRDRLLVFNVTEGWAPLCNFLGVPQPLKPFPLVDEPDVLH